MQCRRIGTHCHQNKVNQDIIQHFQKRTKINKIKHSFIQNTIHGFFEPVADDTQFLLISNLNLHSCTTHNAPNNLPNPLQSLIPLNYP